MPDRNMTVIVTGSSGFIGRAVCEAFVQTAMRSSASIARAPRRHRPASSTSYYDFSGERSPLYEQITVRDTERLLRCGPDPPPGLGAR